jgi:hypothetical protein
MKKYTYVLYVREKIKGKNGDDVRNTRVSSYNSDDIVSKENLITKFKYRQRVLTKLRANRDYLNVMHIRTCVNAEGRQRMLPGKIELYKEDITQRRSRKNTTIIKVKENG